MEDRTRTLIKVDGPDGKNLHYVSVTAGEGLPTKHQCPRCGATMYEFWLYIWKANGPSPIYSGIVCGAEKDCE